MKKLLISVLMVFTSYTMASAELGVNLGVSAQLGTMTASGSESSTDTSVATETVADQEAMFASGSFFIEKELGFLPGPLKRLTIGYDNMAHDLDLGTASNIRNNHVGDSSTAAHNSDGNSSGIAKNNQVTATIDEFETYYMTARITDWLYAKYGTVTVGVNTSEKLETGGNYGNASLDGTVFGFGLNHEADNGMFFRLEYNDYDIEGTTLKNNGTDSKFSVKLNDVSGETARISVGKAF